MSIKRRYWFTLFLAIVLGFIATISALIWFGEDSHAHKISRNIRKGMTVGEVTDQVGKPVNSISMDNANNSFGCATYFWYFDDSRLIVDFDPNGKLERIEVRADSIFWRIIRQVKMKFGL